jgi:hypothetical protein
MFEETFSHATMRKPPFTIVGHPEDTAAFWRLFVALRAPLLQVVLISRHSFQ